MTDFPTPSRRGASTPLWALLLVTAVVALYLAFLGWDQSPDTDPVTGAKTGPYQPWQVLATGAGLILVAFVAGRAGRGRLVTLLLPLALTACFAVDAATDSDADGLWVIGALLVAVGSLLATAAVAALGAYAGHRRARS